MKTVTKIDKYILKSGDEELIRTSSIQAICNFIKCTLPYVYANKHMNRNNDGTWSFNYKKINYTILPIN